MLVACNQATKGYTISGTLATDEFNGKWVYLAESVRKMASEVMDSAQIVDSKFEMKGEVSEPQMLVVVVTDAERKMVEQGVGAYFILENGNIIMNVDTAYAMTVTGTDFNRAYAEYDSIIMSFDERCRVITEGEGTNAEKFEAITAERNNYKTTIKSLVLPYVGTQPAIKMVKDIKHLFSNEELAELLPADNAKTRTAEQPYMAVGS